MLLLTRIDSNREIVVSLRNHSRCRQCAVAQRVQRTQRHLEPEFLCQFALGTLYHSSWTALVCFDETGSEFPQCRALTELGEGVAIPHGKLRDIDRLMICFGRHRRGIDFDAMDGQPAHLFFMLIAPEDAAGIHLKALARISKLLKNPEVRERLLTAPDAAALYRVIVDEDLKL